MKLEDVPVTTQQHRYYCGAEMSLVIPDAKGRL